MSAAILLALVGCAPSSFVAGDAGGYPEFFGAPLGGLVLDRVTLNQGVQVELMKGGNARGRAEPAVVADRPGLLRAFVEPTDQWQARPVQGILAIETGGEVHLIDEVETIAGPSRNALRETTLDFQVPGEWIQPDSVFSVTLHEGVDGAPTGPGATDARWWTSADDGMPPIEPGGSIEIRLIPIRYDADGSGRRPALGDAQVQTIRDLAFATYPVSDVEVVVADTMPWSTPISADGQGWDTLLGTLALMRSTTDEPDNVYYYAIFKPDDSIDDYCARGCVLGLSLLGGPRDVWSRASMGLGFKGEVASETLVHEVGHAHGREHAPCGVSPSDRDYPHADAQLGTWGYDLTTDTLLDPQDHRDMMSYCQPLWVSDYTWDALHQRIGLLDPDLQAAAPPPLDLDPGATWPAGVLHEDGTVTMLGEVPVTTTPTGPLRTLEVVADDGARQIVTGHLTPFDHLDGGLIVFPRPDVPLHTVRLAE